MIRKLTRQDVNATAKLLAEAFADNPCYVYMHPRASTRARDLLAFFRRNLLWRVELELTWVGTNEQGQVLGTVTLEPPGGVVGTPLSMITHWVLPTLWQQGPTTVRRIIRTDAEFKQRYLEDTLGLPYWHVHAVAVTKEARGQGLGRRILGQAMRELEDLLPTRPGPVVLSTQRERNISFYRRVGFELTGVVQMGVGGGSAGYSSWFLRHTQPVRSVSPTAVRS